MTGWLKGLMAGYLTGCMARQMDDWLNEKLH